MSKKAIEAKHKQARINKILDDAKDALEAEGVKYFLAALDREPKAKDGGKIYANMDMSGNDFTAVLDVAMATPQDLTNLGIHVGQLLGARLKQSQSNETGKRKKNS